MKNTIRIIYTLIIALAGWFGILLQLYLILSVKNHFGFVEKLVNFISFFTVLTNIIVAISLTEVLINPTWGMGKFFTKAAASSAIAVYILIVGAVYFLTLRKLWDPQGWQFIADVLLHYAIPLMYGIYWLVFVPKGQLRWSYSIRWLIYPFLYFVYILIRGALSGQYPYHFIDVNLLGYGGALLNAVYVLLAFIGLGLLIIGIDKLLDKTFKTKV